jgi:hypothetical protein
MSRLGGAGAVAQLVADVPLSSVEVANFKILVFGFANSSFVYYFCLCLFIPTTCVKYFA